MPALAQSSRNIQFVAHGACGELFNRQDPEIIISGPAGTGKSRAWLERLNQILGTYPNSRGLMVRKTLASLTSTGLVTFRDHVQPTIDGAYFFGGSKEQPAQYIYPNGSRLVVGGLDNPQKIMSGEYDIIGVQEATETTERDWEFLTTRLRNGKVPFQQIIGDCNPDSPLHWIKLREARAGIIVLYSTHKDNPRLWDHDRKEWTEFGKVYIARLDCLTGVRLQRLRHGRWVAAEGVVYEDFDREKNIIDPFRIPKSWTRFRSIDFGFTNPFVCQWWAVDGDGRMYLYRELYHSQRLVSDMAVWIKSLSAGETYLATVADHDAEDRATLHASGIRTIPARKAIQLGIQRTQERIRVAGDGKPRLFLMRGCQVVADPVLREMGRPLSTEQEIDSYVWPEGVDGKPLKEEPVGVDDHGCDAMRYAVQYMYANNRRPPVPTVMRGRSSVSGMS